jgi:hypothetical protein
VYVCTCGLGKSIATVFQNIPPGGLNESIATDFQNVPLDGLNESINSTGYPTTCSVEHNKKRTNAYSCNTTKSNV